MPAAKPTFIHAAPDHSWLGKLREEVLEPELPIIDPHHHLWNHHGGYFLEDLLEDVTSGHNIVATVYLQCGYGYRTEGPEHFRPVGETAFVAGIAEEAERRACKTRVCAGIVGAADLTLGSRVDTVLEAHLAAGQNRLRGIRHIAARHEAFNASMLGLPPFQLMADKTFREGFARLAAFDLTFDAWNYHTQIAELVDLAQAFSNIPIVLNHTGGPLGIGPYSGKRDEVFQAWWADMSELAKCPNVTVKLGGLAMVVMGFDFHKEPLPPSSDELANAWRPYFEACIELFDAKRCMFESNFPVDKAMCSYPVLWNAFKRIANGASCQEKQDLFHGTAANFYRLDT